MIVDRPLYFVMLALAVVLMRVIPARHKAFLLAATGPSFYAVVAPAAFPWIVGVSALAYVGIAARVSRRHVWRPVAVLAAVWALLKYFGPSLAATGSGASAAGLLTNAGVPLGLSYLTLELIGYQLDFSKGRVDRPTIVPYLAFVWFFPCRIAGPIRRYGEFQNAVAASRVSAAAVYAGMIRILIGFAKKQGADLFGLTVDQLAVYGQLSWPPLIAYPFQIYLDFSAYSDVAVGSAQMLGISVPENFDYPYLRSNIRDFWSSWHITLSTWLRDYVFLNAGGRLLRTPLRHTPMAVASVASLITFGVCGLWHGFDGHFVVWGLYHGALLALYQAYRHSIPRRLAESPMYAGRLARAGGILLTFSAVSFGWIFFKYDLRTSWRIITFMFGSVWSA